MAQSPRDLYQRMNGSWESESRDLTLTYDLSGNRLRVQGESCGTPEQNAPQSCGTIDQDYSWAAASAVRHSTTYGNQPVQILEFTPNRIVRREINPVARHETSVTVEELIDANTLKFTSELWVDSQKEPRSHREFTLRRVQTGVSAASYSNSGLSN
jgi:hypothetical protein